MGCMMKQPFAGTSNVAWFKLAEFVSRGEKERTLSMYRLLAHSFDDPALIKQLEGDLLLTFKDEAGYNAYEEAARLYLANNRTLPAIALYEYLVIAVPTAELYKERLLELYRVIEDYDRVVMLKCRIALDLVAANQNAQAERYLTSLLDEVADKMLAYHVLQELSMTLLKTRLVAKEIMMEWLTKTAHALAEIGQLNNFLEMIGMYDPFIYREVREALKD